MKPTKQPPTINSREVAEMVGKRHSDLLRDIDGYISVISANAKLRSLDFFIESTYLDKQNKQRPCYELTKQGCEFVANKLTGEKGILFTAAYVQKFNMMEQSQVLPELKQEPNKRLEIMEENTKVRKANLLLKMTKDFKDVLSPQSVQTLLAHSTQILTGTMLLELPKVEKTYTATEIGNELGISANKVGRIANAHNLKNEENGIFVLDKSRHSSKQTENFRYNEAGKARLIQIIKGTQ